MYESVFPLLYVEVWVAEIEDVCVWVRVLPCSFSLMKQKIFEMHRKVEKFMVVSALFLKRYELTDVKIRRKNEVGFISHDILYHLNHIFAHKLICRQRGKILDKRSAMKC